MVPLHLLLDTGSVSTGFPELKEWNQASLQYVIQASMQLRATRNAVLLKEAKALESHAWLAIICSE